MASFICLEPHPKMTLSNSASMSSLVIMVIACFLMAASADFVQQKLPSVPQDRQSRQMLFAPESYNFPSPSQLTYYSSYGQPMVVVPGDLTPVQNLPYFYSPLSSGNSDIERAFQNAQADITISPVDTECLLSTVAADGGVRCRKASQARRGTIKIKLPVADQLANFAITAPANYNIRLTCSDVANVGAFTQTGKIAVTGDTPVVERKFMTIQVTSTGADGLFSCSWESNRA